MQRRNNDVCYLLCQVAQKISSWKSIFNNRFPFEVINSSIKMYSIEQKWVQPLTFVQIVNYIFSWDNTEEIALCYNVKESVYSLCNSVNLLSHHLINPAINVSPMKNCVFKKRLKWYKQTLLSCLPRRLEFGVIINENAAVSVSTSAIAGCEQIVLTESIGASFAKPLPC